MFRRHREDRNNSNRNHEGAVRNPRQLNADIADESENNNVDVNSNDGNYEDYRGYHAQYQHHQFVPNNTLQNGIVVDNNLPFQNERRQSDETDSPQRTLCRPSLHRRTFSEDLSGQPYSDARGSYNSVPQGSNNSVPDGWIPLSDRNCSPYTDTQQGAQELLLNFTYEEFHNNQVEIANFLPMRPGFSSPLWRKAGAELRHLADAFARTEERRRVRCMAEKVDMQSVNMTDFFHFCTELFSGPEGITQERIVALFTFIVDVAMIHICLKAEQFLSTIMNWSLRYIFDRICKWVHDSGGWEVVLRHGFNIFERMAYITLACVASFAVGVYVYKMLKDMNQ